VGVGGEGNGEVSGEDDIPEVEADGVEVLVCLEGFFDFFFGGGDEGSKGSKAFGGDEEGVILVVGDGAVDVEGATGG
jgi:hypothetical protein